MAFLRLRNLSIDFTVHQGGRQSIKKMLVAATMQGNLARDALNRVNVRALNDLTFNIENGDRVGLIGANGAGCSGYSQEFTAPQVASSISPERFRLCLTSQSAPTPTQPAARTLFCAA